MAKAYKCLGQKDADATTEHTLYTVPASTSTVVSTLIVCNRAATADTFRVYIGVGGAAADAKQYLYYDTAIPGNDTFVATLGVSLATTDKIYVYAGTTNLSFSAFGVEIT